MLQRLINGVEYLKKTHLRDDGTFAPAAPPDAHKHEHRYIEGDLETYFVPSPGGIAPIMAARRPRMPNPSYQNLKKEGKEYKKKQKKDAILRSAAMAGMRGELRVLLNSVGETYAEDIAFHNSWFVIVERYSIRQLSKDEDKVLADCGNSRHHLTTCAATICGRHLGRNILLEPTLGSL